MEYRPLGRTGWDISVLGFGAWAIGGPAGPPGRPIGWGEVDDRASLDALAAAMDAGVNFIDTADGYGAGHSESLVGQAVSETSADVFIATKVGFLKTPREDGSIQDFSEAHLRSACEASLKRLRRDAIDLYQLHCPHRDVLEDGSVFGVLQALQQEGKIRAYGVSATSADDALVALNDDGLQSLQVVFNLFRQEILEDVLARARAQQVGIIARVPLASGLLCDKFGPETTFPENDHRSQPITGETFAGWDFAEGLRLVSSLRPIAAESSHTMSQIALAWVLDHDGISTTIPGMKVSSQLQDNLGALSVLPLPDAVRTTIDEWTTAELQPALSVA